MRKFLIAAALSLMTAACAGPDRVGVGVAAGGDYYDGYYDGFYGPFNDGYWGDDGAFWYSDAGQAWHRDDAHHFARVAGSTGTWSHIHGSGAHREH